MNKIHRYTSGGFFSLLKVKEQKKVDVYSLLAWDMVN